MRRTRPFLRSLVVATRIEFIRGPRARRIGTDPSRGQERVVAVGSAEDGVDHSDMTDGTTGPDDLDDDTVLAPAYAARWEAKRSGVPPIRDNSAEPFHRNVPWQTYLTRLYSLRDVDIDLTVVKQEIVTRRVWRRDGGTFIDVKVPVRFFQGLDREQGQDIYRLIARDTYVWGMDTFGWPEPPPIPGGVPPHAAAITPEARGLAAAQAGRNVVALSEWESSRQKRPDRLNQRFASDSAWQEYLARVNPDDEVLFTIRVTDGLGEVERESWLDPALDPDDPSDVETTTVETRIPAHLLSGSDANVEHTYVEIIRETYQWAAQQFGWPAPPI